MSRVYEALRRAERENNTTPVSELRHGSEAVLAPCAVERQEVKPALDLGKIARHPWKPLEASFPTLQNRGTGVEEFRALRSRIDQLRIQGPLKTILVSSAIPAEGKTFVAANLAMSMARNTVYRVLLIDGDLRRGTLHNLLTAPNSPGLADYLTGTAELTNIMQCNLLKEEGNAGASHSISNITFIPAGHCGDNSSEVVASHRMRDLIANLSPHFDWIVIDSPPVLAVTDAVELARVVDGVLLVARGGSTKFEVAQRAQAAFSNSRILGFVLNAVKEVPRSHYYSYYYGGEEGERR